eukprot:TRINITY_DN4794_c0_g1_i5.p1 TRINITY_DN4794_c0_g1~~TRINITY_DN4794_c0_g1_i5.p1  ORF type:complete len:336 (+),score=101.48 TRINITY_DN4794_c0_g1_i5:142-1149(+)
MGQNEVRVTSSSKYGSVALELGKGLYLSGELIEGMINLVVFQGFPIASFDVSLLGFEIFQVDKVIEKHNILSQKLPIRIPNMSAVIQPGNYSLPFGWTLPRDLPSSLPETELENVKARVEYWVKVEISSSDEIIPTLSNGQGVTVKEPLGYEENMQGTVAKNIYSWWCIPRGISAISIYLPKNGLHYKEERLRMRLGINHAKCSLAATGLELQIVEKLAVKTQSELNARSLTRTRTVAKWAESLLCEAESTSETEVAYLLCEGAKDLNLETVNGKNISRIYSLLITPKYDACSVTEVPTFFTDIFITTLPLGAYQNTNISAFAPLKGIGADCSYV